MLINECKQGSGKAIRSNINAAVDTAANDHESAARNEGVAERGLREMEGEEGVGVGDMGICWDSGIMMGWWVVD